MKTQYMLVTALIVLGAIVAVFNAAQPDAGLLKFTVRGDTAYGNGQTDDRSVSQITAFLDDNPNVDTLVLQKMWGTADADMNIQLARKIRKRGLNTHLGRRSYIASGAVDLFLAGRHRTMECGAMIGVHSWSGGKGYYPEKIGWDPREKYHEDFLRDMGIDPAFYAFSRDAAPPDDLYYLTAKDIERFGLLSEPLNCD